MVRVSPLSLCVISSVIIVLLSPTVFCRKTSGKRSKTTAGLVYSNATTDIPEDNNDNDKLTARILQVINPQARNEFTVVSKAINSEVVVGKDLVKGARILLECSAPYPVQWIYSGDGVR